VLERRQITGFEPSDGAGFENSTFWAVPDSIALQRLMRTVFEVSVNIRHGRNFALSLNSLSIPSLLES
jgi:hypothetical protein